MRKLLTAIALFTAMITFGAAGTSLAADKAAGKGAKAAAPAAAAPAAASAVADAPGSYWDKWPAGKAKGPMPECGVNVLPLGGDDILQATVDTYCKLKPGAYESYINPAVKADYDKRAKKYADGKGGILVFKAIGVGFTTDFAGGKIVYDVIGLKDAKSMASKDKGHPLNPETCATCHASFNDACKGGFCGNRH
jgi:hypothetical protein